MSELFAGIFNNIKNGLIDFIVIAINIWQRDVIVPSECNARVFFDEHTSDLFNNFMNVIF